MNKEEWLLEIVDDLDMNLKNFSESDLYKLQVEVYKKASAFETSSKIEQEARDLDFKISQFTQKETLPSLILQILADHINVKKKSSKLNKNTVVCLDRDLTTSTGMPPGPISVKTIKKNLKEKTYLVLATGNQLLKNEAKVPGKLELQQVTNEKGEKAKNKILQEYKKNHEYRRINTTSLKRRQTIQKVKRIFPNKTIVVIDDANLSDIENIQYYEPHEFFLLHPITKNR